LAAGPARIILFTPSAIPAPDGLRDRGVETYAVGDERVDLRAALGKLSELGMERVLVEGGGTLNFELLRLDLVDEVQVFVAPLIFGGLNAPTLADGPGLARDFAVRLERVAVEISEDGGVLLRYKVNHRE
jgi:2,5-diamino-6-(ribosylamino)-4(3H)-pyrimidinone 5'-phosphate reductase